jgi:DNA replication and repair protein RecF
MHLAHISILNYKNIRQVDLNFNQGINCFVGNNGAGKTNLLDSIYYLSFCKSYFNPIDSQVVTHGEEFLVLQGHYNRDLRDEEIYAGLKRNQKKQFKRNKKEYPKLSDHIGLLPLVMVSPGDERLIVEGSDQRRKYIDSVISQCDKTYLEYLIRYNRALNQRNTLVKNSKSLSFGLESQLEVWDDQLALLGGFIFNKRAQFINELMPVFQKYYNIISDGHEKVEILYHSHHQKGDLIELLKKNRERDIILGYTTKGIHRDDLELLLNGYAVKKDGSQGQKKSFLIALKLAQFEFLSTYNGFAPILLLDDVFDKLDNVRGNRLIELVSHDSFKQIFITDTQQERLAGIVSKTGKPYAFFNVQEGEIAENVTG